LGAGNGRRTPSGESTETRLAVEATSGDVTQGGVLMRKKVIIFGLAADVTPDDYDGKKYRFPFAVVEPKFSGSFTNEAVISEHFMVVEVTGTVRDTWKLTDDELKKVMFALGVDGLLPKVKNETLAEEETVGFYSTSGLGSKRPYDPSEIGDPEGAVISVEIEKPSVGF